MKNPQVFVGAGFKPALRRDIDLIRPGNALGGFETRPYETVLRSNVCDVFTLTFHGAHRHAPNDEIQRVFVQNRRSFLTFTNH